MGQIQLYWSDYSFFSDLILSIQSTKVFEKFNEILNTSSCQQKMPRISRKGYLYWLILQ